MYYVLTTKMEGEWRPVGVVDETQKDLADQWADRSPDNDWIGFEMNDLSMVGLTDRTFEPKPSVPAEEKADKAETTSRELVQINRQLLGVIEALAKKHNDKIFLDLIKKLKAEGKIASEVKTAVPYKELQPGMQVWFDARPDVKGVVVEVRKKNKDNPQSSFATVDWGEFGKFDVPVYRLRLGQQNLFAANKRWESFKTYKPELQDEILRLRHTPSCKLVATGKCTCKPCPECGAKNEVTGRAAFDEQHTRDCPAMFPPQQTLF